MKDKNIKNRKEQKISKNKIENKNMKQGSKASEETERD